MRREQEDARAAEAEGERIAAAAECAGAERDLATVQRELEGRSTLEQEGRDGLRAQRTAVRELEEDLQRRAEALRALEGERAALERERGELGQQLAQASGERAARAEAEWAATAQMTARAREAAARALAAAQAAEGLERTRRRVAELKEQETHDRAAQRQADEALAQVTARRDALAELERQRVGLAPAAQALLRDKAHFGDVILGPLSDFVRTNRRDAQLAEQLLGEWLHAVLVRDDAAVEAVRQWHQRTEPGPLVLLPCAPGPRRAADGHPLADELRVDGPAAAWVRALLAGHEVLDGGRALRRANGAVFLAGAAGPSAPGWWSWRRSRRRRASSGCTGRSRPPRSRPISRRPVPAPSAPPRTRRRRGARAPASPTRWGPSTTTSRPKRRSRASGRTLSRSVVSRSARSTARPGRPRWTSRRRTRGSQRRRRRSKRPAKASTCSARKSTSSKSSAPRSWAASAGSRSGARANGASRRSRCWPPRPEGPATSPGCARQATDSEPRSTRSGRSMRWRSTSTARKRSASSS